MTDETTAPILTDSEALAEIRELHEKWQSGDAQPTATVRKIGQILDKVPATVEMVDEYQRGWESVSASSDPAAS